MPNRAALFSSDELDLLSEFLRIAELDLERTAQQIEARFPKCGAGELMRKLREQACDLRERIEQR